MINIVILCKRRPQNKDLWERPNGRFYHFAKYLAEAGCQVDVILLNYKKDKEFSEWRDGLMWHSINLLPDPFHVYCYTRDLARGKDIHWFIGFSDVYFGILAVLLARQLRCRALIDAYDNYESYIAWCKPLHWCWRYALKYADAITAPGKHLLGLMSRDKKQGQLQAVLPMSADGQFQRMDKTLARKQLGLPIDCKLVGYCGSAHESRDMEVFFEAMDSLAQRHPDYRIVMSGFLQKGIQLPAIIIHLGYLPDLQMPVMINALDVMVSVNKPSVFGNYSYPAKIYEALACGVPVIASATASVAEVLGNNSSLLVPPGNAAALAEKIECLLAGDLEITLPKQESWQGTSARLYQLLAENTH